MEISALIEVFRQWLFALGTFLLTTFQAAGVVPAPCEQPLVYTVGTVDAGFQIPEDEVRRALTEAEAAWEKATGRNLFEYRDTSGLPVHFIYDERQQKTDEEKKLNSKLEGFGLAASEQQAEKNIAEYEKVLSIYESHQREYEKRLTRFNARVEESNKNGGADENTFQALKKEERELRQIFDSLETERNEVNTLGKMVDKQVKASNALVEKYNNEVETFNTQYADGEEEFDQGVYTGDAITIYQYDDYPHLVLVLVHEMGHALGLDHVEDKAAVMNYLLEDQGVNPVTITESDLAALRGVCQKPVFPWQQKSL